MWNGWDWIKVERGVRWLVCWLNFWWLTNRQWQSNWQPQRQSHWLDFFWWASLDKLFAGCSFDFGGFRYDHTIYVDLFECHSIPLLFGCHTNKLTTEAAGSYSSICLNWNLFDFFMEQKKPKIRKIARLLRRLDDNQWLLTTAINLWPS